MKINIVLNGKLLDDKDYDFFHYEESYKLAECEYGDFYIASRGELNCAYLDKKGNEITRNYNDIIRYYIKNNFEYENAVDKGQLVFDLSNWFEIEFYTKNGNYICFTDEVLGNITECLMIFLKYIENEEIMKEFENDIKEVLENE